MSKMIIYFSLFIPLLFLSTDSSSTRDRTNKNELVPFLSSRVNSLKRDSNNLKIVSNEPFIIQLQMPNSREKESKRALEKDKKRKRPVKKRVSKIKPLRRKNRARRELITPKKKIREQKLNQSEIPHAVNATEQQMTNLTKNSINRMEILKVLSSYSRRIENKRSKSEEIKDAEKMKHNTNKWSRNLRNHDASLSDQNPQVKMIYPNTPEPDQHQHKYTYKDLMADRERLEQKIKYIKNMLNMRDSTADDTIRVRRRSDSDRTANKIAKMFLTLSAVNGLHDRRKSKCWEDDEEEDRVQDDWEKERRNNPNRKSSSSNEERYKVKKWIEYMKNKRSSGKICPCMTNEYVEESDVFPLELKLPKGYFLRGRSSEESSESHDGPFYYSRDKLKNNNLKNRFEKSQEQENKLKALAKNGKKKLELPFDDLEIYRSRAKQILQNAEEILDKIKEEEEKRLHSPNIFMSQLKELTSQIPTDPRNNENDLIQKIQKNLGWSPLAKSNKETDDNTFMDSVKFLILDPYEKAKALTDESTKKLSSYLLRNLGKLRESSEEQEKGTQETAGENPQVHFEKIPQNEEKKPISAGLAKEDLSTKIYPKEEDNLKNNEGTLFVNLNNYNDEINNEGNHQEEIFKQKVEDINDEQQKKVFDYKVKHISKESSQEADSFDQGEEKIAKAGIETVRKTESEENSGSEETILKLKEKEKNENDKEESEKPMNSDSMKKIEITETIKRTAPAKEEFKKEIEEAMKANYEKDKNDKLVLEGVDQEIINADEKQQGIVKEESAKNKNAAFQELEEQEFDRKGENKVEHKEELEKAKTSFNTQETSSRENTGKVKPANQKKREENVLLSPHYLFYDYDNEDSETPFKANENLKDIAEMAFEKNSLEAKSSKEITLPKIEKTETETNEEDSTEIILGGNNFMPGNVKELTDHFQYSRENVDMKKSFDKTSVQDQKELFESNEKQNPSNAKTTQTSAEYPSVVKESIQKFKELLESNHSKNTENIFKRGELSNEEQEEKLEKNEEQNLIMETSDDETNQPNEDEREKERLDDGTVKEILENSEELEKKLDENRSKSALVARKNRENLNESHMDTHLKLILEKNSNDDLDESEKAVQESQKKFNARSEDDKELQLAKFLNKENEIIEKNINDQIPLEEALENRNQYENENESITLKTKKPTEEMSNESLDKSKNEDVDAETSLEKVNKNKEETESNETFLRTAVDERSNEKDLDTEDVDETFLREAVSKEDSDSEVNEKLTKSNEEGSSETILKSHLKADKDLEVSLKVTNPNQNIKESNDKETENTVKDFSKVFQKNEENGKQSSLKPERPNDNFKNQDENEKDGNNETITKTAVNKKDLENLNATDDDTTSVADLKDKEVDRTNEKIEKEATLNVAKPQFKDWNENHNKELLLSNREQNVLKKEESKDITLKEAKPDKDSQENQSSENFKENNGEKILKAPLNEQNEENPEVNDPRNQESNRKLEKESSGKTLKEILSKEIQKNLNESPDDETVKGAKLNEELKQILENVNNNDTNLKSTVKDDDQENTEKTNVDEIMKEESFIESKQRQDNLNNEASTGMILDNQKQATKMKENELIKETNNDNTERKLNENKSSQDEENLEKMDGDDTPLRMANSGEDESNKERERDNGNSSENNGEVISSESTVGSQNQEKKEVNNDETIQAENLEHDRKKEELNSKGDRIPLKTASSENESDNKTERDETPLKAAKDEEKNDGFSTTGLPLVDKINNISTEESEESEETSRKKIISDDVSNQIDQENEDENFSRSKHFDEANEKISEKIPHEENYETLTAKKSSVESLSAEEAYEPQLKAANSMYHENLPDSPKEQNNPSLSDIILKTGSTKTDKLEVPKSIGKIMEALEGKEKDNITSFRSLNPDKIDHILDKIDEAEQRNLLQSQEIACRKDCACAEEIGTKSRNMGRYEIVKDFLFWMKDLQLNRVLTDD